MLLEHKAIKAFLVWTLALTLWFSITVRSYSNGSSPISEPCCAGEQANYPLAFKWELISFRGIKVSFVYGIDGTPTRIALSRDESC